MPSPRTLLAVSGLCLALAATAAPAVAERPEQAGRALVATDAPTAVPARPVLRERFVLHGRAPAPAGRTVLLQKRTPQGTWSTVDDRRTGPLLGYRFGRTATPSGGRFRVLAPATSGRPRWISGVTGVPTVADRVVLTLQGDVTRTVAVARLLPARAGRTVALRTFRHGAWRSVLPATRTDGAGVARFVLPEVAASSSLYSARVSALNGAPGYVGPTVSFAPAPVVRTLPRLDLTTAGAVPVTSKEDYLAGTLSADGAAPVPIEIRGRGNSTWTLPKKPYRIKLGTSASLFGMNADKDWALLANFADRSSLRNRTAFAFARAAGLGWTPQSVFVDVTLNGTDIGLYQLTEHVEAKSSKVALADGGLLLENDQRMESEGTAGIRTPHQIPLAFKDPDEPTPEQVTALTASATAFEEALYGDQWQDPVLGYAPHVDLDSFVNWYLVNEVMKNLDADGNSSMFLSWDPAGVFSMSNVWDFDLSGGFALESAGPGFASPEGWWLRGGPPANRPFRDQAWLVRMSADPAFRAALAARWQVLESEFTGIVAGLDEAAAEMRPSSATDWALWHVDHHDLKGAEHAADAVGEAAYLQQWLHTRLQWIDAQLS